MRLGKADAELLISALDTDLLVDALRAALSKVLEVEPFEGGWGALVRIAGEQAQWSEDRVHQLIERQPATVAVLAVELSELRTL